MIERRTTNRTLSHRLERALSVLSINSNLSRDEWGNGFGWFTLKSPDMLPKAAGILAEHGARLCTVTAYARTVLSDPENDVAYHFDINGYTLNIVVQLSPIEVSVPTITPWFRNADWNEREFMELYDIHVEGHPNPRRLFLHDDIEEGVLNEAIPLTILMNGACSRDLWERVMEANRIPTDPRPPLDSPLREESAAQIEAGQDASRPAQVYQAPGTIPPVAAVAPAVSQPPAQPPVQPPVQPSVPATANKEGDAQ